MYSFARSWCRFTKKLYLARDRFGEKAITLLDGYHGLKVLICSSDLIFDKLFNKISCNINPQYIVNDLCGILTI